jgi:hypothetical protein
VTFACCPHAESDFDEWKRALKSLGSASMSHNPNTMAVSQRTAVVDEPVTSWPPEDRLAEDGRTWSPESAVVAAEAAALVATDPDALGVRQVVAASDKTTALMESREGVMERSTTSATPTVLLMGWGLAEYPLLARSLVRSFFVLRESTEEEIVETSGATHMLVTYKTDMEARVPG